MDPQEITDLPLHAVQHPFVYDGVFKVRVYYGSKGHKQQSLHARMDGKDLHRHITDGTSPTGQEDADGLFYASQLVHYGLPTDRLQPRAIRTLKDIFKMRNGTPTLHVPDTIRVIERKLKKEYETLVSKSNVSRLLDENQVEIEALQTKLAALRKAFKAEEQDLLATLKPLEVLSTKYKAQLASIDEAKKAVNEEVKNENDVASDVEDDLPSAQTAGGKKRKQAEGIQRSSELPSRADASQKRTRIYTPSEPPVRREMTILPTPGTPVQNYQRRFQNQQPASATRKRTPVAHSPNAQRKATPARRFDSNPPSAHTRDEHRRRELLKHTTGTWQITPQNGQSTTRNSRFSLSIGKIFQRQHQNQFQGSSQYIQRHILSFTFGDLVGYGCSVANAKLVNDRLKIVFSWRALQEASVEQSSTSKSDRRSLKLIFDRYSLEGYLYGSTSIEEGYVFYGTYSAELTPAQQPEKWQQEYDACRR